MLTLQQRMGFFLLAFALASSLVLSSAAQDSLSLEWRLFESFVSNYSKSYRDDPSAKSLKFKAFQVWSSYSCQIASLQKGCKLCRRVL